MQKEVSNWQKLAMKAGNTLNTGGMGKIGKLLGKINYFWGFFPYS